jgi:RarD protein
VADHAPAAAHAEQRAGIIAGAAAYVVWGLLTIYWKQLGDFDAFELIGWRITAAAVVMAVVLTFTRGWRRLAVVLQQRALLLRVAAASVLLTVNWTAYVSAVVQGHVLETALGYFIAPLGTVTVGVLVLHEPLRAAQKVALGLAAIAVVVLTISYGRVPWLALLIAASWTAYGYLKKHVPLTPVESMAAESFLLVVPAVVLAVAMASRPDSIPSSASATELSYRAAQRARHGGAADAVRLRSPTDAAEHHRADAVHRAVDELPDRLAALRRTALGHQAVRLRARLAGPGRAHRRLPAPRPPHLTATSTRRTESARLRSASDSSRLPRRFGHKNAAWDDSDTEAGAVATDVGADAEVARPRRDGPLRQLQRVANDPSKVSSRTR